MPPRCLLVLFVLLGFLGENCHRQRQPNTTSPMLTTRGYTGSFAQLVEQANRTNRPLRINSGVDLRGQKIDLGKAQLHFEPQGMIVNGTLSANGATHQSDTKQCYRNIRIEGVWGVKTAHFEWFSDVSDNPVDNFEALCQAMNMGEEVLLHNLYPIAMPDPSTPYDTPRPIRLRGTVADKTGLILETQPTNVFFGYFRTPRANSLVLDNLTIRTRDYARGLFPRAEADYVLATCYYQSQFYPAARPDVAEVTVRNCRIEGAVALAAYGASSDNQTPADFQQKNHLGALRVVDSQFDHCNAPFGFSNMGYGRIEVRNCAVRNFSGAFVACPASGLRDESYYEVLYARRGAVVFENNIFENEKIVTVPSGRALTPCVIKGGHGTFRFANNKVRGLRTRATDAEVYTWYYTCSPKGRCEVLDNEFVNCVARGSYELSASLVKERGAGNWRLENNIFEIKPAALVDIGVFKSENQDPATLQNAGFYCDLIQIGTFPTLSKQYTIRNNTFRMPYCNLSVQVSDVAGFIFENNKIDIGYWGSVAKETSVTRNGVLFLGRERMDRPTNQPPLDFVSRGNVLRIGAAAMSVLHYLRYPEGVQSGAPNLTDQQFNYKNVVLDDRIEANNLCITYELLDAENQRVTSTIEGKNATIALHDHADANHHRPSVRQLVTDLRVQSYRAAATQAPFALIPNATQSLRAAAHDGGDITVLNFSYLNSLYPLEAHLPVAIDLAIEYTTRQGQRGENTYSIILSKNDRSVWHQIKGKQVEGYDPSQADTQAKIIEGIRNTDDLTLQLVRGDRHLRNAELKFSNAKNIASFTLQMQCTPIKVNAESPVEYQQAVKRRVATPPSMPKVGN
jgi:hypothetical protein